jgi:hypothetical protein
VKASDIPLVHGGELTGEMIAWIEKVSKVFPGVEKDIVVIRKPGSGLTARGGSRQIGKRENRKIIICPKH